MHDEALMTGLMGLPYVLEDKPIITNKIMD